MDRRPWWVTVHGVTKEWDTTEHKHKCARKDTRKFPDQQGLRDWRSGPRTLGLWHVDKEETDGFPNHRKDSVKEDAPERQRVRWKWERVKGTHTAYGYESGSDSDTSVKLPWKLVWCFIKEAVRKFKAQHLRSIINWILSLPCWPRSAAPYRWWRWQWGTGLLYSCRARVPGGISRVPCWMKMHRMTGKNRKDHQPFSSYPSRQPLVKGAYLLQFIASKVSLPLLNLFGQHALGFASHPDY